MENFSFALIRNRMTSPSRVLILANLILVVVGFTLSSCSSPSSNASVTLRSVAMVSANEGWAVGESTRTPASVFLHYINQHWTFDQDASRALDPSVTLAGISMLSTKEGWAVGSINIPDPPTKGFRVGGIIIHYLNGHWRTDTIIQGSASLRAVAFRTPSDGWAAGDSGIYHYDGAKWQTISLTSLQTTPIAFAFTRIALSGSEAWFGGFDVLLHYDSTRWSRITVPQGTIFQSFAMDGSVNGVALLNLSYNESAQLTDIWHLTDGKWMPQTQFPVKGLADFNINATGDGWAVGENGTLVKISSSTWKTVLSPTLANLMSLAIVSTDEAWIVGDHGTILHYLHGTWKSVSIG